MFCFEEFKYSYSCISKCNSFYLIFCGGVMSLLTISFKVHDSYCFQEWGILNTSISLLELSWVIFHLKPSIGNVAICGAYHWSKLSPYPSRWKKFSSLRCSQTSNCFSLVAECHLIVLRCFHKPTTSLFFSLLVFQQPRCNHLGRVLSKLICGTRCHFILRPFIPTV